jgi:putative selenium metabolism protein SsnA
MPITLTNAVLLNLDPLGVTDGSLRIEGDTIADVGPNVSAAPGDETVDCRGCVVMPGLVNGHTHLYSALATGMPLPSPMPGNFQAILERIWWRLDRALDPASIEAGATIGALDALHCGTTTLIDHHASPNCITGSLDLLERGIDAVGLRAVFCYETTDRNGEAGAFAGLEENRRYLVKCRKPKAESRKSRIERRNVTMFGRDATGSAFFAAMVGAHASFTLSDDSLKACADSAAEFETGVHIHVAEDPCDDRICRETYGAPLVERLQKCGLLNDDRGVAAASVLAHGTHFSPEDAKCISAQCAAVAHNPRSNMNNRVGHAPIAHMSNVLLGTDGIGSDMFTESKHAWFKACDARIALAPSDVIAMLAHGARVAGDLLDTALGRLTPGAAADVVITDYRPATPLDDANAGAHLIFALGPQHVRHVLIAGRWTLQDRAATRLDEPETRSRTEPLTQSLWSRMQAL